MYAAAGANNLNGGSGGSHGRRQVMSSMDFYRRVPKDLTEVRYVTIMIFADCIKCSDTHENSLISPH